MSRVLEKFRLFPDPLCVSDDLKRGDLAGQLMKDRNQFARVKKLARKLSLDDIDALESLADEAPNDLEISRAFWIVTLLDDLELLPKDPNWQEASKLVRRLNRFGSYRLASERMWACRFLADDLSIRSKGEYMSALKQSAKSDPDVRVKAWAAAALFCHEEHSEDWESSVNRLRIPSKLNDIDRSTAEMAIDSAIQRIHKKKRGD